MEGREEEEEEEEEERESIYTCMLARSTYLEAV